MELLWLFPTLLLLPNKEKLLLLLSFPNKEVLFVLVFPNNDPPLLLFWFPNNVPLLALLFELLFPNKNPPLERLLELPKREPLLLFPKSHLLLFEFLPNNEFPCLLLLLKLVLQNNLLEVFPNKNLVEFLSNKPTLLALEASEAILLLCKLFPNKDR